MTYMSKWDKTQATRCCLSSDVAADDTWPCCCDGCASACVLRLHRMIPINATGKNATKIIYQRPCCPGCLQSEERAKPACAVDSPTGTNVECTVGRQNILPVEPQSVLTHGLCAISELDSRYHTARYNIRIPSDVGTVLKYFDSLQRSPP